MISIIIPTYNESENISSLIQNVSRCMEEAAPEDFEILVMDDDSPDGTARCVEAMGHSKVRAVNRRGKTAGLSASVVDGFSHAAGQILVVMDADGSHPPEKVPELARAVESNCNIAVGSRYVTGGGTAGWPWTRVWASKFACFLARPLTPVRDATSGFFALKKTILDGVFLDTPGFKIGLEVFIRTRHQNLIQEVPYIFKDRQLGASKLNSGVMGCYVRQLLTFYLKREKNK